MPDWRHFTGGLSSYLIYGLIVWFAAAIYRSVRAVRGGRLRTGAGPLAAPPARPAAARVPLGRVQGRPAAAKPPPVAQKPQPAAPTRARAAAPPPPAAPVFRAAARRSLTGPLHGGAPMLAAIVVSEALAPPVALRPDPPGRY